MTHTKKRVQKTHKKVYGYIRCNEDLTGPYDYEMVELGCIISVVVIAVILYTRDFKVYKEETRQG